MSFEQIRELLLIDLKIRNSDNIVYIGELFLLSMFFCEDLLHSSRDYSPSFGVLVVVEAVHCVGFASSCLAICNNG